MQVVTVKDQSQVTAAVPLPTESLLPYYIDSRSSAVMHACGALACAGLPCAGSRWSAADAEAALARHASQLLPCRPAVSCLKP